MTVRVAMLAGAAVLALASVPASAQSQGPYVGIGGGMSWLEDADVNGAGAITELSFDPGWAAIIKGGYALGNGFRPELEIGARGFDVDGANGGATAGGDANMYTAFANLMYDFMPNGSWSPYLGAGLGVARVTTDARVNTTTVNDADTTWATQAIAGAWFALTDNWLLSADYRYQYHGDVELASSTPGVGVDLGNQMHTVMLGLTYRFGSPAPAPMPAVAAPAPAPAPAAAPAAPAPAPRVPETYIIFFPFDSAQITPVAGQVLDRAIADFRATGSTNVRIEGNADRSGSQAYNQRLSQRRADAAAAYMREKGIGAGAIQTAAFGEDRPRVPTADGVRNDENRNAQIFLRK